MERDEALGRVSRARRWLILAAAALSAGVAALVSAISPGHTLGAKAQAQTLGTASGTGSSSAAAQNTGSATMPPLASPGDLGLQGPGQNPQPGPDPSQSQQASPDPSQSAAPQPDPAAQAAAAAAAAAQAQAPAQVVSGGS